MAESAAADPKNIKAKQQALKLMRRGMDMAGQWRHEEALHHFEQALTLVPTGRFARMAQELRLTTLRTLGRGAEADALQQQAQAAVQATKDPPAPSAPEAQEKDESPT
jgi:hypothetical protein